MLLALLRQRRSKQHVLLRRVMLGCLRGSSVRLRTTPPRVKYSCRPRPECESTSRAMGSHLGVLGTTSGATGIATTCRRIAPLPIASAPGPHQCSRHTIHCRRGALPPLHRRRLSLLHSRFHGRRSSRRSSRRSGPFHLRQSSLLHSRFHSRVLNPFRMETLTTVFLITMQISSWLALMAFPITMRAVPTMLRLADLIRWRSPGWSVLAISGAGVANRRVHAETNALLVCISIMTCRRTRCLTSTIGSP